MAARRTTHLCLALSASMAVMMSCKTPEKKPAPKLSGAPEAPANRDADLVFVAGKVRTLDPSKPLVSAVAIKNGRITAVGEDSAIEAWVGPSTKVIGLDGRALIPGLVDSHLHLAGIGLRRFGVDLVGLKSLEEVTSKVGRAVADAKPGAWVRGFGWDQNDWEAFQKKGLKFPSARDLDAIAPENPVVLVRIDGHASWANSKALELAGIKPGTKSPAGGQIILEHGRPSGVLIDNAMALLNAAIPPLTKPELFRAYLLAQQECLEAGLTQVHDMGIGKNELAMLKDLDERGELKLRVYAMLDGQVDDLQDLMGAGPLIPKDPPEHGGGKLTVRGIKFYADGALGSRGACMFEPYSDDAKNKGLLLLDPDYFEARVRTAKTRGFQVATHAIGDRANRLVLDVYDRVFGAEAKTLRPRVEHAQVLAPEDVPRFGKSSIIASMQPTHATSDMDWAEARLGPTRIRGAYAWRSVLNAHGMIAAGSDAPIEEISPIAGLYSAVTRRDSFGMPPGGWRPEEKLTAEEALKAFTQGGAYSSFREDQAGMIAEGRVADLTVLDQDPLGIPAEKLLTIRPQITVIGGELVYVRVGADHPPAPKPVAEPDAGVAPAPVDAGVKASADAGVKPSIDAGATKPDASAITKTSSKS